MHTSYDQVSTGVDVRFPSHGSSAPKSFIKKNLRRGMYSYTLYLKIISISLSLKPVLQNQLSCHGTCYENGYQETETRYISYISQV